MILPFPTTCQSEQKTMKKLWNWLLELDQILRGEATRVADLKDGSIKISVGGVSLVLILLGMLYGLCMAVFVVVSKPEHQMQLVASAVKVPALFLLTLLVTLPSLYVFTALVNARLTLAALVRLFVAAIGVNIAVLASLGPIVAFFSINTVSYYFIVLLNVLVFAVSGVLGLAFLLQTLHRLNIAPRYQPTALDRLVDARRAARWEKLATKVGPPAPFPPGVPIASAPAPADEGHVEGYITPEVVEPGASAGSKWIARRTARPAPCSAGRRAIRRSGRTGRPARSG